MANYNVLSARAIKIFSMATGHRRNPEKCRRRIAWAIILLKRDAHTVYGRGRNATIEDKLQLRQLLELLSTVRHVSDFVTSHKRNALFREVNPYGKFGEDGAWIFEQLTNRYSSSWSFEECVRDVLEAFKVFDQGKYSEYGDEEDSFLTAAERSNILEEGR